MTKTIKVEGLGNITVKKNIWTGSFALLLDGKPMVKIGRRQFSFTKTEDGAVNKYSITIQGDDFRGYILFESKNKKRYQIISAIPWYGYVLVAFPLAMVLTIGNTGLLNNAGIYIVGGAIGGLIGGACSGLTLWAFTAFKKWYIRLLIGITAIALAFFLSWLVGDAIVRIGRTILTSSSQG